MERISQCLQQNQILQTGAPTLQDQKLFPSRAGVLGWVHRFLVIPVGTKSITQSQQHRPTMHHSKVLYMSNPHFNHQELRWSKVFILEKIESVVQTFHELWIPLPGPGFKKQARTKPSFLCVQMIPI